jgi:hypothetical protein
VLERDFVPLHARDRDAGIFQSSSLQIVQGAKRHADM